MTGTNNRRAPIPRPWLAKKRQLSSESLKDPNIDVLDRPQWTISWSKLLSCFCVKEQSEDRRHHDVPFPAFPLIRRNSLCSESICELYNVTTEEMDEDLEDDCNKEKEYGCPVKLKPKCFST